MFGNLFNSRPEYLKICATTAFLENNIKDINLFKLNFHPIDFLPKNYTITTSNGSYKFNYDMIKDSSSVIQSITKYNNNNFSEYQMKICDDQNIMKKLELIYRMEQVIFEENEIFNAKFIFHKLGLKYYIKDFPFTSKIGIDQMSFFNFLKNLSQAFCFIINKKSYFCNKVGIYSSDLIRKLLEKNPITNSYSLVLNEGNDSFQIICDFFNFESITLTPKNVYGIKEIAEKLNIVCLLEDINNYIIYYKYSIRVMKKYSIIDSFEELFQYLYNREKLTPKEVFDVLVNSIWCQSEGSVKEMAACIIQVIYNDILLHPFLMDLIELLDQNKNKIKKLNVLLPTIVRKLMIDMGINLLNCAFIYRLSQKKIISLEEIKTNIKEKLNACNFYFINYENKNASAPYKFVEQYLSKNNRKFDDKYFNNVLFWFYPEMKDRLKMTSCFHPTFYDIERNKFINEYKDNLDEYNKMRECGEPTHVITKF